MRMRQQLIIIAAVVFATVAVGMNVYASTRSADQRSHQLDRQMPVASVLDRGIFDAPRLTDPPEPSTPPGQPEDLDKPEDLDDPCAGPVERPGHTNDGAVRSLSNHGREVSAIAAHIGHRDCVEGPPGALVSENARPDVAAEGPPRSDRAEDRSNTTRPSPPPSEGKSKDKDGNGQNR